MKETDYILIERYLMGEATEAERSEVETRMASDPAFQEDVAGIRTAIEAVRAHHRAELYEKFKAWDEGLGPSSRASRVSRTWLWVSILAIVLVIILAIVRMMRPAPTEGEGQRQEMQEFVPDSTGAQPVETAPPPMAREDKPDGKVRPSSPETKPLTNRNEALFAEYYRPNKDPLLNPEMRGAGDPATNLDRFRLSYWEGNYAQAVTQFEQLPEGSRQAENDLFCYAGALLVVGRTAEAASVFDGIVRRDRSMFVPEARFALAMARLRMGDLVAARSGLEAYIKDPLAKEVPAATQVLKALSR
jgi:hypothetical protein